MATLASVLALVFACLSWSAADGVAMPRPAVSRRGAVLGAAATALAAPRQTARAADSLSAEKALRLFEQGKYDESLAAWTRLTEEAPGVALYWSNRGTAELVVGSEQATLGVKPTGDAERTLLSALASFDRAAELGEANAVALNNRGNVYNALMRWREAADAYDAAIRAATSRAEYATLPTENRALVAMELGDLADAQRRVEALVRRDPNFLDSKALLAAVKFARGDKAGAEDSFSALCRPTVAAPNQFKSPIPGIGGTDFCELYSSTDFVKDRWTPAAVTAYAAFLRSRDKNARIAADSFPFDRSPR